MNFNIFWEGKRSILISLQKFPEMCSMTYHENKHRAKLSKRGTMNIWKGYADGHQFGTFCMLHPKICKISLTNEHKSYDELDEIENLLFKQIPHKEILLCSRIEPEWTITHDLFLTGILNLINIWTLLDSWY